jgi:hypothetical protein
MLSRGYAGSMPRLEPLSFARSDVVFLALLASVLLPVRVVFGVGA